MRNLISALLLVVIVSGLAMAQEEAQTPYEIALQRIEEAERNNSYQLDLLGLGLTVVPPEIGRLNELEYLRLDSNNFTRLPAEIGDLSNLRSLSIVDGALQNLPVEIGMLSRLETLWINNTQLSSVPPEIGNLNNLKDLDLSDNQLAYLPNEIGNLVNLERLDLANNQLRELPPQIGNLKNLCFLGVENNQLQYLPTELAQLQRISEPYSYCLRRDTLPGLTIFNNPLISPLRQLVEEGGYTTLDILEYLRNEAWWHFQRLLLGGLSFAGILAATVLGLRWKNRRKGKKKNEG